MFTSYSSFRGLVAKCSKLALAGAVGFTFTLALPADSADAKRRSKTKTSKISRQAEGPLTLMISLSKQRVAVYDKNGMVTSAPISSGARGHRTPTGVFTILQKRRRHYSNLYHGASMPNMQRITWSGIALHAGHLPGYPASHGCIRLPYSFSKSLFQMTELGSRVIVTHAPATPQSFAHAKLLRPLPAGEPEAVSKEQSKDTKSSASAADLLLGVTPAHASEYHGLPEGVERTRSAVKAFREREIQMLETAVATAESTHKEAGDELKTANVSLQEALQAERLLQPEANAIEKRLKTAEAGMAAAKRKFRDFLLRASTYKEPEQLTAAAQEEDALESEALLHMNEFELARADRAAFDKIGDKRKAAVKAATGRRDTLKSRFVTTGKSLLNSRERLTAANQAFERRERPITVLFSKHSNKVYVRQGYDPVLEADVTFENPDAPLGTHVYHAVSYTPDGEDLSWQAVTANRKTHKITKTRKSRRSRKTESKPAYDSSWPPQTARNALQRVNISDDLREKLAELMKPGSAIIITDERKSYETGKYTDLIVTY